MVQFFWRFVPGPGPLYKVSPLVEENKVIITDKPVVEDFSSYFEIIIQDLDLGNKAECLTDNDLNGNINKFENYPSIMKIEKKYEF